MEPFLFTTWSFGPVGNDVAYPMLARGWRALDAAIEAATVIELEPSIDSVGVGGLPDRDGRVSLDACVMENPDRCGAVACIRRYATPSKIARDVMNHTIHVTLVGEGAEDFAHARGYRQQELLTESARDVWRKWRADPGDIDRDKYRGWIPPRNVEELRGVDAGTRREPSHDTVGILAMDKEGRLGGVCSTSGMAFKVPGRVGDSPIIGHGLYVDQRAGAACATGAGELATGVCASFLAVELMRRGASPIDALRETLGRIIDRFSLHQDHQLAMLAVSPKGERASVAMRSGFRATITDAGGSRVVDPDEVLLPD